jgi:hypothetical protein
MNRRTLLGSSLALLAGAKFGCCSRARAEQAAQGCRLSAAADAVSGFRVVSTTGSPTEDLLIRVILDRQAFGVHANIVLIDDGYSPNAFASPRASSPDGPDGTVLIGVHLLSEISSVGSGQINVFSALADENATFVTLHELAHILQFKRGMSSGSAWQMEPHADFLAGWAYAKSFGSGDVVNQPDVRKNLELGVKMMFELGDTAFNDPRHHGEPQFRAAMVRAGFDSANLGLDEAFERGKKYAGLQ